MPAASEYRDPNSRELRQRAEAERRARANNLAAAQAYYLGNHRPSLRHDSGVNHNVAINLCQQVVDRVTAFLFPKMPTLELKDSETQATLRTAWDEAGGVLLLQDMAQSGGLGGHVFAKVVPGAAEGMPPRIINLNPATVQTWWREDDIQHVLWYSIQWGGEGFGRMFRQDVVRGDDGQSWRIVDWVFTREWQKVNESQWNSPYGPVIDWRHDARPGQYYGAGELTHAALNDRINAIASDMNKVLYYHASPRTVATGVSATDVKETAVDNLWTVPDAKAKVTNLTLPADALQPGLDYIRYLEQQFLAQSRVVRLTGDIADFQRVTNLGVKILYGDQLAKNEELKRRYERGIQEISRRVLYLQGREPERPTIIWPDPLPQDPLQTVEYLERTQALGLVSRETMAHTLGIDWGLEQVRMLDNGNLELLFAENMSRQPGFGVSSVLSGGLAS